MDMGWPPPSESPSSQNKCPGWSRHLMAVLHIYIPALSNGPDDNRYLQTIRSFVLGLPALQAAARARPPQQQRQALCWGGGSDQGHHRPPG